MMPGWWEGAISSPSAHVVMCQQIGMCIECVHMRCKLQLATHRADSQRNAGHNSTTTYVAHHRAALTQVVNLAGRCAERLVLGEGEMTAMGAPDLFQANMIAREMVLSMGMGRRSGPMDMMYLMDKSEGSGLMLRATDDRTPDEQTFYQATDMSTEQVRGY